MTDTIKCKGEEGMERNVLKEKNVMKKWKQHVTMVLMLTILVTLIPVGNVQAKSKSPAKLGAKDFIYTENGKKFDFLKVSENQDTYYGWIVKSTDTKVTTKKVTVSRKVKIGKSTESYVRKQYGNTAKKKVSAKDKIYKMMKYRQCGTDISIWKNYLEYNYKKSGNKYKIRFYLDKMNKVAGVVYIKNLDKFYNYPNKELNLDLKFQAPKGKRVTTKTINGKKVYMVPRGTKIKYNEPKSTSSNGVISSYSIMSLDMYDVYGDKMGSYDGDNFASSDLETIMDGNMYSNGKEINIKKLSKYLYFIIKCSYLGWDSKTNQSRDIKDPAVYYFKFK